MFQFKKQFSTISFFFIFSALSLSLQASEITDIKIVSKNNTLKVNWQAHGQHWKADVEKINYLVDNQIQIINVSVKTGNEERSTTLGNVYYRGTLTDNAGDGIPNTTVYLDLSENALPFTGFVANDSGMYIIEADTSTSAGIRMRLEQTANDVSGGSGDPDSGNGWKKGGKGGALKPTKLVSRNTIVDDFPSLDIYVDPSYITNIGEANYVSRVLQNLALANTIFAQSNINEIRLTAIVLPNEDIARSSSQGSVLHGVERLRKYTVQKDSADISMVYSGEIFNQPSLWGWAEGGFGCELQQAAYIGNNINTHQVGKAAFAVIDLPTLMQRGWIFAHEASHTLGGGHIADDPLSDGFFQPELTLKDYVATCDARKLIYQSCDFDPQTKAFTDFYSCEM